MRLRFNRSTLVLALISFIVVVYAEWIYPAKAFEHCVWPLGDHAKHIVLIADPQLVDEHTYKGRNWLFLWISQVVVDRFMARNFRLIHTWLRPDSVFFLGDLFDGGREWEDKIWHKEYTRWRRIFPTSVRTSHIEHLPGNHDVGCADEIITGAFERFRKVFGNPNQVTQIAHHSIVTLDTLSLMNSNRKAIYEPATEFFEKLKANKDDYSPMIILTHVPLYRPDGSYCGLEREEKAFDWVKGPQYITEVTPQLTQDILYFLSPKLVFSGDDHDSCKYTHHWATEGVCVEHTVKSFSMAMGIKRPGFQLLSLDHRKEAATDSCVVHKPFYPLQFQAVMYTLLVLFVTFKANLSTRHRPQGILPMYEKKHHTASQREVGAVSKGITIGLLALGIPWVLGQLLITSWSYTSRI